MSRSAGSATAWMILLLASGFEVAFAVGLKTTHGFTRLWPSVLTVVAAVASFVLLSQSLRTLPVGTGYAAWTGIGAVGATIIGIVVFGEPHGWSRLASVALIIAGVLGLRLSTPEDRPVPAARPSVSSAAGAQR